jgi:hypothetical protein
MLTSVVTSDFRSPVTLISPNIVSLPQPSGFLHHLHCPWRDCSEGESRLHSRRRVSWEQFAVFTAAHVISYVYECLCDINFMTFIESAFVVYLHDVPGYTWFTWLYVIAPGYVCSHLVIYGCTWLCVVSPSVTFLNHCLPWATVFTTRYSYMFQHKREMCTKAARVKCGMW